MVYALYNPSCGINLWDLNYKSVGAMVDLRLHLDVRPSSASQMSFLEREMRTRVFWVVHTFDRTLCTMMGRPLSIRDDACEFRVSHRSPIIYKSPSTKVPNSSRPLFQTASSARQLLKQGRHQSPPSHMTYSIHLFKLARLNSEIIRVMHDIHRNPFRRADPLITNIYEWQKDMIDRLHEWSRYIPCPRGLDFYLVERFCAIKYAEMMVLLLRSSHGIPKPTERHLEMCYEKTQYLIHHFWTLCYPDGVYRHGGFPYSKLVLHSIFFNTLIMLHCLWRLPDIAAEMDLDILASDIAKSRSILSGIGEYWIEAKSASRCLQRLHSDTVNNIVLTRDSGALPESSARLRQPYGGSTPSTGKIRPGINRAFNLNFLCACDPRTVPSDRLQNSMYMDEFLVRKGASDLDSKFWDEFNNNSVDWYRMGASE